MAVSNEVLGILVRLEGKTAFVAGVREEQDALRGYSASAKEAAASSSSLAAADAKRAASVTLVNRAMLGLTVVALGAGVEAVKAAIKWNDMGKTISQQTGLTGASLESMMSVIMQSAQHAPYAIDEIASAAVLLRTKFHLTDTQIQKTAGLMAAFAQRAGVDTAKGTTTLLSILQDYQEPLNTVVSLSDKLISVSQATQKPMGDLLNVIEKYGPKLQAMGFGLNETIRMLGVFQASGISTNMMGRGLSAALTKAAKEHETTGESIPNIIQRHIREVSQASSSQESLNLALKFFGAQVGPTFSKALFNNAKALEQVNAAMGKTGSTNQVFQAQQKEVSGQWEELRNQLFKYEVELGKDLIPVLKSGIKDLMGMAKAIISVTDNGKLLIPIIGTLAGLWVSYKVGVATAAIATGIYNIVAAGVAGASAAAALGVDGLGASFIGLGVAMDAAGIGLIFLAITLVIIAVYELIKHFKAVKAWVSSNWPYIAIAMATLLGPLGMVAAAILAIITHWRAVKNFVVGAVHTLGHALAAPFDFLWAKVKWVFDHIKQLVSGGSLTGKHSPFSGIGGGIKSALESLPTIGPLIKSIPFAAGGVMPYNGFATINENGPGETVWLPGGSRVTTSSASSMATPRAHTPNPTERPEGSELPHLEAILVLPNGDVLSDLVVTNLKRKKARL